MKVIAPMLLAAAAASALSIPEDASLLRRDPDVVLNARAPKGGGGGGGKGGSGSSSSSSSSSSGKGGSGSSSSRLDTNPATCCGDEWGRVEKKPWCSGDSRLACSPRGWFGGGGGSGSSSASANSGSSAAGGRVSIFGRPLTGYSSGKTGSSSSGKGLGSSSSSTGGRTKTGSGVTPNVGGFYGGGARVPFAAGQRSSSGISPLLIGSGIGFGFGAPWVHGAYIYPYAHPFVFHNSTTNATQTKPVNCLCAVDEECGCDENSNSTYVSSLVGNGSYTSLNQSLVTVADINDTSTIVINGTLPNGTTAAGGTVSANGAPLIQTGGYLALAALISAGVFLI